LKDKNISSGILYKFYQTLKQNYKLIDEKKWADVVLNYSKLVYMLVRNLKIEKNKENEFRNWFTNQFGKLEEKDIMLTKLSRWLFKLAYNLYKARDEGK
jgi:hypothetical protein